uniref:Uncharacterized protein n=1 Tax=Rhizophora mucronata TaxID=61149 RepID=A0A2P2N939_RHIMU
MLLKDDQRNISQMHLSFCVYSVPVISIQTAKSKLCTC